ncbi:MAG TPA: TGS domain-containing protein, partial [Candidatus Kapabacteria bacterium]|nr:TGS domain-containing protein [Candidatus Kapabacteria bacterium]
FISEKGVAAHFNYKRGLLPAQSVLDDNTFQSWMDLVRLVFEHLGDEPPEELIKSVRKNLLQEEIYVFTKTNEFRVLPNDATPLDFAYSIHTEIGNHCIGAKVNGRIVPLDYKLQSGDQIEILTSKSQFPTKEWLKLCVTNKAHNYIQKYINDEKRKTIENGRDIYNNSLNKLNISLKDYQTDLLFKHLHFASLDEMLFDIGNNKIDELLLINSISNWYEANYFTFKKNNKKDKVNENISIKAKSNGSYFDNSLPIKYAQCCYPIPNDEIIGILNEQMEIEVHRINCKNVIIQLLNKEASIFNLEWDNLQSNNYLTKILIQGEEIPSLLSDISTMVLSLENTSIKGFNFDSDDKGFKGYILITTDSLVHLNEILEKIRTVNGILSAERYIEE